MPGPDWTPTLILVLVWAAIMAWALNKLRRMPALPAQLSGPPDAITIGRAKQYSAMLRQLVVLIDGKAAGRVGPGEIRHFPVAPGNHTVSVKLDWCTARPVQLEKAPDRNVALRCGVKSNVAAFFRPRDYAYVSMDTGGTGR